MNKLSDIGLIGLAVMGQNLALNIADHKFKISVFNRTVEKTKKFVADNTEQADYIFGAENIDDFVKSLSKPRKIIILVQAGAATDEVINNLTPLLDKGDIIIDGGNAHWLDTIRREKELKEKGLCFIGSGVSGGEVGARFGPALMPGGEKSAWQEIKLIWQAIAAKVDAKTGIPISSAKGSPCTAYIGENGAGHYVKMIHNGIEYGDMQMIAEAYSLLSHLAGMKPADQARVFEDWNKGILNSYLIEITAKILETKDTLNKKKFLIDMILDTAGQKGTGKWTSVNALDMGVAAPSIAEAVFARYMSANKDERVRASKVLAGPSAKYRGPKQKLINAIHDALYCSKICSYAQGFHLMHIAQKEYGWKLNFAEIAQIWRGGCIIRAGFLQKIASAYKNKPNLDNLLLDPYFRNTIKKAQANWREVVALAAKHGIPVPTLGASLAYYDSYRLARLPANLIQAQRDYFGAHTFERVDKPRGQFFRGMWDIPNGDNPRPPHEY